MSLFTTFLHAIQTWRRRRVTRRNRKRAGVALEQLDHRQLLSVNFTGNVVTDFPDTQKPGVVVLPDNPAVIHPLIPPFVKDLIKVSGLDINGVRLSYTASDDTLSIGLQQPLSQQASHPGPVIAGDTDNNGDSGTVAPAVLALDPGFKDFPDLGGSETMGAFLSLKPDGLPTVVAGISNEVGQPKFYQVADAVVNPMIPTAIPGFGTPHPANTGNVYLVNDPNHPNFEFDISHFSQLYQQETGKPLTPDTTFGVGAFGNSQDDDGISEAFFPAQTVQFGNLIKPPPCPPASPPVLINPHLHRHINTAHPTLIRVNVFGTSGFDVTKIEPDTVRLGGAAPVESFTRKINRDEFLDATFVFKGTDVTLPPGITEAEVTGTLNDGTTFDSKSQVFNRDKSFFTAAQIAQQEKRQAARESQTLHAQGLAGADQAASTSPAHEIRVTVPIPGLNAATQRQGLRSAAQRQSPAANKGIGLRRAHQAALASADMMAQSLAT